MPKLISQLILNRCPHCQVDSPNLTMASSFTTNNFSHTSIRVWKTYTCNRCGGVTLAAGNKEGNEVNEIYPTPITVNECIPDRAKEYLDQAINSLHAPAGAIMLAAASVDAMLKSKGYNDGSLYNRINKAAEEHLITDGMSTWAHQVRLGANGQRHADNTTEMPKEIDAQRVIDFTISLAEILFVLPSRVEEGITESTELTGDDPGE